LRGASTFALALIALGCHPFGPRVPERPLLDPDLVQRGALLFLDARLSADGSRSCASCHPGGGTDGKSYRDGAEVAAASEGARDTTSLRGAWQTPPYLWDGSAPTLRDAVDRMLAVEMGGARVEPADRDALVAFVLSLDPFDRGRVGPDGAPLEPSTLRQRQGFELFKETKCALCHAPPVYARGWSMDVGTGGKWDVPSLRGLSATAPYGHDARWSTVEQAVRAILAARETPLDERDLEYLLEYLKLL
jgi:cytochrome c peroxidase